MILFTLNPINWIKDALVSDYVGGWVRHGLTALGAYLLSHALVAQSFVDIIVSKDFVGGVISIASALVASAVNKKVP